MTRLVSADGGYAGVAIVDAWPLKRTAQDILVGARAYVLGNGAGHSGKTRAALARW